MRRTDKTRIILDIKKILTIVCFLRKLVCISSRDIAAAAVSTFKMPHESIFNLPNEVSN